MSDHNVTPPAQPGVPSTPYPSSSPHPAPSQGLVHAAPYGALAHVGGAPVGQAMKRRNVVGVWLGLPLITLGIYGWVWWYKINAEMGRFDPRRPVGAGTSLLAVTLGALLIVPPYVSVYNTGKRIAERQQAAGIGASCSPVLGIVLMFVFGLYTLYYQSELNKISDALGRPAAGSPVQLRA